MIERGASVNTPLFVNKRYSRTYPIHWAVSARLGARVLCGVAKQQQSHSLQSAGVGDVRLLRLLVERGADVESKSFNGYTPAMWAASSG
jgi:ankyrin repeat protein